MRPRLSSTGLALVVVGPGLVGTCVAGAHWRGLAAAWATVLAQVVLMFLVAVVLDRSER